MNGFVVLDKPAGITSRQALDQFGKAIPRSVKRGHTGTLDPLATGVLVLALGKATRLTDYVHVMDKAYDAEIVLGASSNTDDADGDITPTIDPFTIPTLAQIETALTSFLGWIDQVPPQFSAVRLDGKRAYNLARKGEEIELAAKSIRIDSIQIVHYDYPKLQLQICCGKGTYIRSLARDLGQKLGCMGFIATLRRTRVGPFRVEEALPIDAIREEMFRATLPMQIALTHLPQFTCNDMEKIRLSHGAFIPMPESLQTEEETLAMDEADSPIAVCETTGQNSFKAKILLIDQL